MSVSFYQLGTEYQNLLPRLYDLETGEVDIEVDAKLNALSDTAEKKCIALVSFIKSLESEKREVAFMKAEIAKREAAYDKTIQKWNDYLITNMERNKINEVKCPLFTIRLKKNPYSTDIYDESQVPERFIKTREIVKVENKVDKVAIKEEVLRTGLQIPGAVVQQKTKLEILTDKL